MNRWVLNRVAMPVSAIAVLAMLGVSSFGQTGTMSSPKASRPASNSAGTKTWNVSRTPDGQPDLQGMWVNFDSTPLERPDPSSTAGTPAPAPKNSASMSSTLPTVSLPFADIASSTAKRPSLVVDPPNGRIPLSPWAEQTRDYFLSHVADSWEYNTPWERCITRGVPGGIFPVTYDNAYQILQTPGYVVILYDMIHDARIIPIDGRPHLPSRVRQWNGDPRGHWERNTLVVETTNFNGKAMFATANLNGRIRDIPESDEAYIVERFTRTDEKTISYEVTIRDPKSFTAPWTVAMPLSLDNTYQMYEYACHEGNQNYMEITLGAGRQHDKEAEEKQKDK